MLPATLRRRWRHFLNTCLPTSTQPPPWAIPPTRRVPFLCLGSWTCVTQNIQLTSVCILGIVSMSSDKLVTCLCRCSVLHGRFDALKIPLCWPLASTDVPTDVTSLFWAQTLGLFSTLAPVSFHSLSFEHRMKFHYLGVPQFIYPFSNQRISSCFPALVS